MSTHSTHFGTVLSPSKVFILQLNKLFKCIVLYCFDVCIMKASLQQQDFIMTTFQRLNYIDKLTDGVLFSDAIFADGLMNSLAVCTSETKEGI